MIVHSPWVGDSYKLGIQGKRVCVIGFSHHTEGQDHSAFTEDLLIQINGYSPDPYNNAGLSFFINIRNYFGFRRHQEFWPNVMFFNFLPNVVGASSNRYGPGSAGQLEIAAERVLRLFQDYKPEKAFLFSAKAWDNFPETRENRLGYDPKMGPDFGDFRKGHYDHDAGATTVYRLRHPQFAKSQEMTKAVQFALKE